MSALVILECNACGAITPPWPTADKAREEAGPEGWAVDVDGSNIDYCPQCTAPARQPTIGGESVCVHTFGPHTCDLPAGHGGMHHCPTCPTSRLDVARDGITQLRDALLALSMAVDLPAFQSVSNLARVRADQLLLELAS